MNRYLPKLIALIIFWSVVITSCKKSDPAPLGAQVNAVFLAGDAGKSKSWKLRELSQQVGSGAVSTLTLPGCFADNLYTFSNNAAQDYAATEGTSKCYNSDAIESGTWAFTLDGLQLDVQVDNTQTPNGLFSPEPTYQIDTVQHAIYPYNFGYTPYPAFVQKIDANNLVLQITYTAGTTIYKYTLTFTPA